MIRPDVLARWLPSGLFRFKVARLDPFRPPVMGLPLFFGLGTLLYRLVISRVVETLHSARMLVTLGLVFVIRDKEWLPAQYVETTAV